MKNFTIAIGSDHAGFAYKEALKAMLLAEGHVVRDFGTYSDASCDYPGITTVTRQLLTHWFDRSARQHPFYFCQLEAIETLIWWVEAADAYRQGVFLQGDGGPWERVCSKMATGSGKTTVMAMLITWQVLNAVTYPKRTKDFLRLLCGRRPCS